MATRLTVSIAPHVQRHYHVLACLDVGTDPASVFNPAYRDRVLQLRPSDAPRPDSELGRFHRHFRQCASRFVLPFLPLVSTSVMEHQDVIDSVSQRRSPAQHLSTWSRRIIGPLATDAGARLVATLARIQSSEIEVCLRALEQSGTSVFGDTGAGLSSYLNEELLPLCATLFGNTAQTITIFPSEAVGRRSWSVLTDRTCHRIVVAPNLRTAYLQALVGLCRHRTDRLIRPFLPVHLKQDRNHPLNRQIRLDAAYTVAYHILQRYRSAHLDMFIEWVSRQFEDTSRRSDAAVAALRPMELIPEDARAAVEHLIE